MGNVLDVRSRAGMVGLVCILGLGAAACSAGGPAPRSAPSAKQATSRAGATAGGTSTSLDVVLTSASRTVAAESAKIRISMETTAGAGGGGSGGLSFTMQGTGEFDFADGMGQMTLSVPSAPAFASVPGEPSTSGISTVAPAGSGTTVAIREVGGELYIESPSFARIDGGKAWIRVDQSSYLHHESSLLGPLAGLSTGDPMQALAMLRDVSSSVTRVGTAQMNGVAVTEYRADVKIASLFGKLGQSEGAVGSPGSGNSGASARRTRQAEKLLNAHGIDSLPLYVWIDGQGRVRQVEVKVSLGGVTSTTVISMSAFGIPVAVAATPAAQTANGSSLMSGNAMSGMFGGIGG